MAASLRSAPPPRHSMRQFGALDPGIGSGNEAAFIAFLVGDLGELSVQRLDDARIGAQHDTWFADRLVNGVAQCALHIGGGQGIQRDRDEFARHHARDLRRLFADFLDIAMCLREGLAYRGGRLLHALRNGLESPRFAGLQTLAAGFGAK